MSNEYYIEQLYPLQDKVLNAMKGIPCELYLTGGTALSRAYLHHRYSDDLDFFTNQAIDFEQQVKKVIAALKQQFGTLEISIAYDSFIRCFIHENEVALKLEFVNDVPFRVHSPIATPLFTRTDHISNILSNKISALSRNEAKDIADIWGIAQIYAFDWPQVIKDAQQKDIWVDESEVSIAIDTFNSERLSDIRWIITPDLNKIRDELQQISHDILLGKHNSLCQT